MSSSSCLSLWGRNPNSRPLPCPSLSQSLNRKSFNALQSARQLPQCLSVDTACHDTSLVQASATSAVQEKLPPHPLDDARSSLDAHQARMQLSLVPTVSWRAENIVPWPPFILTGDRVMLSNFLFCVIC
ncbi:hypothetical protein B0T16DRAFT_239113 [Cercophora newfieldiana]|uniref:Uncharacterized protein n=1 Tax=Cercophora newfieldiana TaxID=92897 RepID=A0AA40CI27_9PEZI|nr:hypothetical protein B0T16DRAFT_239113 [Cercophora newfieldiana]